MGKVLRGSRFVPLGWGERRIPGPMGNNYPRQHFALGVIKSPWGGFWFPKDGVSPANNLATHSDRYFVLVFRIRSGLGIRTGFNVGDGSPKWEVKHASVGFTSLDIDIWSSGSVGLTDVAPMTLPPKIHVQLYTKAWFSILQHKQCSV